MGKIKYIFIFLIALLVVAAGMGIYAYSYYNEQISDTSGNGELVEVEIPAGATSQEIATVLKDAGLIENELVFSVYLRREAPDAVLKAGNYEFYDDQPLTELVEELTQGAQVKGVRVTLREGLRMEQKAEEIVAGFAEQGLEPFPEQDLLAIMQNPDSYTFSPEIGSYLAERKPDGRSLEGFLYPDTYEFAKDTTALQVIEKMLGIFAERTADVPLEADGRSFYENLTLASIVEKESFTNEERPTIASVFDNRLAIGQALESDATVNYATGKSNPRPTFSDLQTESPYNTYKNPGLPPGPINSPRIESIEAAADPADSDYFYFIHEQDGSGQVH
ncbi:MAG: endolytic transglycosylase MltG, partial [Candidatus Dojkabacteria bacterium]